MNLEVIARKGCLGEEIVITARNGSGNMIFLLSGNIFKSSIPVSLPAFLFYLDIYFFPSESSSIEQIAKFSKKDLDKMLGLLLAGERRH